MWLDAKHPATTGDQQLRPVQNNSCLFYCCSLHAGLLYPPDLPAQAARSHEWWAWPLAREYPSGLPKLTAVSSIAARCVQASTTRQISPSTSGTLTWVVGPASGAGMALQLQRRGAKHVLTGKAEVGAVSALSARVTYALNDSTSVRAQVSGGLGCGEAGDQNSSQPSPQLAHFAWQPSTSYLPHLDPSPLSAARVCCRAVGPAGHTHY